MAKSRNEIKDLRQFGTALAIILFIFGTVNFFKGRIYWYPWFFASGVIIVILVLAAPKSIKPIFKVFTKGGHAIGWVNTRIILALIYFLIITPIAIVMKIFGKDPLDRKIDKGKASYWIKCAHTKDIKTGLEKQF